MQLISLFFYYSSREHRFWHFDNLPYASSLFVRLISKLGSLYAFHAFVLCVLTSPEPAFLNCRSREESAEWSSLTSLIFIECLPPEWCAVERPVCLKGSLCIAVCEFQQNFSLSDRSVTLRFRVMLAPYDSRNSHVEQPEDCSHSLTKESQIMVATHRMKLYEFVLHRQRLLAKIWKLIFLNKQTYLFP